MGILKIILIIICSLPFMVSGQVSDTTIWNVYFFKGDSIVKVIETDVVIDYKKYSIYYKEKEKFILKEKDFFLSRERLSNKIVKEYYKP